MAGEGNSSSKNNAVSISRTARIVTRVEGRTAAERRRWSRSGKMRPMILLWALGVPIPIILIIFLVRGCMG